MINKSPARRFGEFAALCLVLSWVPWTVMGLLGVDITHGPGQLAFGLAASGPSFAALLLWLFRRDERIRGMGRTTWYGLAAGLMLGAAGMVLAAVVLHASDLSAIGTSIATVAASVGGPLAVIGYTLAAGPLSEEFGWRGYLQPRLRQRFGPMQTALVLGLAWGTWHVPLFLLPGTGQHQIGLLTVGGLFFFVSIIPMTYIMVFVTERLRGGVWAGVAAHAGFNAASALMPSVGTAGTLLETMIMFAVAGLVAVAWKSQDPQRVRQNA